MKPHQPQTSRLFVKRNEAAAMMGLSLSSIVRLTNDGTLPHVKIGGSVLIPHQAILDLVPSTDTNPDPKEVQQ
jgi:excisionase family DNA binding protein